MYEKANKINNDKILREELIPFLDTVSKEDLQGMLDIINGVRMTSIELASKPLLADDSSLYDGAFKLERCEYSNLNWDILHKHIPVVKQLFRNTHRSDDVIMAKECRDLLNYEQRKYWLVLDLVINVLYIDDNTGSSQIGDALGLRLY